MDVGVIDVKNQDIETPEMVAEHIRKALNVLAPERVSVLTDCGCFHLARDVAFAKLKAMVDGTKSVRKELGKDARAVMPLYVGVSRGPAAPAPKP